MMENNGADFVQRWETYQKQDPIEAQSPAAQNAAKNKNRNPQITAR